MSYQTGTASSPVDLLQKLATWLATIGWTVDSSASDASGWRMHVHKGSVYANFRAAMSETAVSIFDNTYYSTTSWSGICLYLGSGYNGLNNWKTQPGGPVADGYSSTVGSVAPMAIGSVVAYHFFADSTGDNIIVVVERTAGVFTHFGWGTSLEKIGAWTGGPYFYAPCGGRMGQQAVSNPSPGRLYSCACPFVYGEMNGYVRADVDSFTGKWIGYTSNETPGVTGYTGKNGASSVSTTYGTGVPSISGLYANRYTNQLNGQSLLVPIHLTAARDGGLASYLGIVPHIFLSNACAKGFTPSAIYAHGVDNYMLFPGPSASYGAAWPSYGFAVKKV